MRIVKYNLEMNIDGINTLVREKSANYPAMKYTDSPLKIAMMCNDVFHLNRLSDEHCILLALNAKCKPIGLFGFLMEVLVQVLSSQEKSLQDFYCVILHSL